LCRRGGEAEGEVGILGNEYVGIRAYEIDAIGGIDGCEDGSQSAEQSDGENRGLHGVRCEFGGRDEEGVESMAAKYVRFSVTS